MILVINKTRTKMIPTIQGNRETIYMWPNLGGSVRF